MRLLEPGQDERVIAVVPREREDLTGELVSRTVRPVPKNQWLAAKPRTTALFPFRYPADLNPETVQKLKETQWKDVKWKHVPTVSFEVECSVSVPRQAGSGKVLLLVEFPGREHRPSRCAAWVDGRPADLEERSSDEHIGYYNWTGDLRAVESEWCWYICTRRRPDRIGSSSTARPGIRIRGSDCGSGPTRILPIERHWLRLAVAIPRCRNIGIASNVRASA